MGAGQPVLTETCAECGGQGTIHETWDCGAGVDTRCDFCNGTGEVQRRDLYRSPDGVEKALLEARQALTDMVNEALVEVYKRRIEQNIFEGDDDGPAVQS